MCHEICDHPIAGGDHLNEQDVHIVTGTGEELPVFVVFPEKLPAPAVMIVHDIYGAGDFYRDLARRLAMAGYIAALPDFYFRQGPIADRSEARARGAKVVQASAIGDSSATLTWLKDHDQSTGNIGAIGMCWGGTMVMLAAATTPKLDVAIPFYGFPVRQTSDIARILPIDDDQVAAIQAPIIGFWGDQDSGVGMDNVAAYDQKLTDQQKPHEFEIYPNVGHAFLTFDPNSNNFAASSDAWNRTLAALELHLANG